MERWQLAVIDSIEATRRAADGDHTHTGLPRLPSSPHCGDHEVERTIRSCPIESHRRRRGDHRQGV
eukprot:12918291-Prorocentrum_lima.AAC.1